MEFQDARSKEDRAVTEQYESDELNNEGLPRNEAQGTRFFSFNLNEKESLGFQYNRVEKEQENIENDQKNTNELL